MGISYIFSHGGLECIPSSVQFAIKCFCFFLVFVVSFFLHTIMLAVPILSMYSRTSVA